MIAHAFDLSGRVALVTGASRGLGAAMARGLAQAGADVAIHASSRDPVETVAAVGASVRTLPLVGDLRNRADADRLVAIRSSASAPSTSS